MKDFLLMPRAKGYGIRAEGSLARGGDALPRPAGDTPALLRLVFFFVCVCETCGLLESAS